ncbi:MAG TPA: DinB family protein [Mycobacteriales bacterium]|jgi:uncharacterized damage-inducible protein DinB|nr:DinB family protein [Mycobacteriales bacterium]
MTSTRTPASWDDRTILTTFLDDARATVHRKCADLSEDDARAAPLPTSPLMSISGVVHHLRWVEYWWFRHVFLGEEDHGPWTDEDPDREFRIAVDIPLARLLAEYEGQAALHRELVAAHDLDERAQQTTDGGFRPTLRWIVLHLTDETARHNGHLDVLRELADGVTGD